MTHAGTIAAIDCGTNSTRLLIVNRAGSTVAREMRITRLGEGVDATRTLSTAAITRTLRVLVGYRELMDAHGVSHARLVATSAVRDATNGGDFLVPAAEVIGREAELLPGDEEGRLSYQGATAGLESTAGDTVVLDIGGGSTEIVIERDGEIRAVSMELGCVRLTERFLTDDPPTAAEMMATAQEINGELKRAVHEVPALGALQPDSRLIGLAGTVSTLAALELGLTEYDRARVHHAVLDRAAVERWCRDLASESAEDRARRAGMLEGRQDVIVGGALVLREVLRHFSFGACLVSESDILDGLVMSQQ